MDNAFESAFKIRLDRQNVAIGGQGQIRVLQVRGGLVLHKIAVDLFCAL